MQIIPVIDLLGGKVVHAKQGDRDNYRAIISQLTSDSNPIAICDALMGLYPFQVLYIADIDRIRGNGDHLNEVAQIVKRHPNLNIWLDAGCKNSEEFKRLSALNVWPVIGSESLSSLSEYEKVVETHFPFVLSLDFKNGEFIGPSELLNNPDTWPRDVVAMSMSKVGSSSGIDQDLIKKLGTLAAGRNIYVAGGVRNVLDLDAALALGCAGALIATALHNKTIQSHTIAAYHKK